MTGVWTGLTAAVVAVPLVALAGALALVASQPPAARLEAPAGAGLDFSAAVLPADLAPLAPFVTRDGSSIGLRHYAGPDGAPLVILLHGSGWHGAMFDGLASALAGGGHATVLVPDLRGHGPAPARRGDADRVGQVEDDIADLIAAHRADGQRVVLGGFSLGGGTVVRFAGGPHGAMIDRALLLAPYLHHRAPTTRPASGGWAVPLVRRFVGMTMLNAVGIRALNRLTVIQYRFPAFVLDGPVGGEATPAYSWTLYQSLVPRADWRRDAAALPPFLLVAGAADEAFVADAYQPTLAAVTDRGRYVLLPGIGHLALPDAPALLALLAEWLHEP